MVQCGQKQVLVGEGNHIKGVVLPVYRLEELGIELLERGGKHLDLVLTPDVHLVLPFALFAPVHGRQQGAVQFVLLLPQFRPMGFALLGVVLL